MQNPLQPGLYLTRSIHHLDTAQAQSACLPAWLAPLVNSGTEVFRVLTKQELIGHSGHVIANHNVPL